MSKLNAVKNAVKKGLKAWNSKKDEPEVDKKPQRYHFVEGVLYALLARKQAENCDEKLNVLQIGANDGFTVDPLYTFCCQTEEKNVRMAAVEPISDVRKELNEYYRKHPSFQSYELLIGTYETGVLYAIKREFWGQYRGVIGSGISSLDYAHVLHKVKTQLPKSVINSNNIDEIIVGTTIPCVTLTELVEKWGNTPDFIQIDAEGLDDDIIYSLDLSRFRPKAWAFETSLLSEERKAALFGHLVEEGYLIARATKDDHCALLVEC